MRFATILFFLLNLTFAITAQVKTDAEREQAANAFVQQFSAKYLNDGKAAFEQQKYDLAIKNFNSVLLIAPENGEAYFYRGRAFVNLNMYERGMLDYNLVLKTSYKNPQIYLLIAKLEKAVGRNEEAFAALNEFFKLLPDQMNDRNLRWMRGRTALFSDQNQTCIEDFTFVLSQNPNDGASYFNRAVCQMEAGSREAAKKDFAAALKINESFKREFYYQLFQDKKPECKGTAQEWDFGFGSLLNGEYDVRAFEQAYYGIKCFPNDPLLYRRKIELFTKFAAYYPEDSVAAYQKYIKRFGFDYYVNPFKIKIMNQTGNKLLMERSDNPLVYKTAAEYLKQGNSLDLSDIYGVVGSANSALMIEPNNAEALLLRARAFAVGNPMFVTLAWRDATNVLKINPNSSIAYNVRGLVLKSEKNYTDAIGEFNRALNINPNEDRAYANIGAIYELQGKQELAVQNFNKAIQIVPANKSWLTFRGNSYFNSGKFLQAIDDYKRVLQLDDKSLDITLKLIQTYEKTGDTAAANAYVFGLIGKFPDDSRVKELAIRYPNASANNALIKSTTLNAEAMSFRLETNRLVEEDNSLMNRIESIIDYDNKTKSKNDPLGNREKTLRTLDIVEEHKNKIIQNSQTIISKANSFLVKYEKDKEVSPEIVQLAKTRITESNNLIQQMNVYEGQWKTQRKQLQGVN